MMFVGQLVHRIKWALYAAAVPVYRLTRRPFSPGYQTTRLLAISSAIDCATVRTAENLPASYGVAMDERVIEYPWLFSRLSDRVGKMLDAGSVLNYEYRLRRKPLKGAVLTIVALVPEKQCFWFMGISNLFGDLRKTDFADGTFDTIGSISTIEHIGLGNTTFYTGDTSYAENDEGSFTSAVKEFKRILKPGGNCFISFPWKESQSWLVPSV